MYSFPYIFVFFLLTLLCFPIIKKNNDSISFNSINFIYYYLVFLIFVVFFTFRGEVYMDWPQYKALYESAPVFSTQLDLLHLNTYGWEKGYFVFAAFCKLFSEDYFFFQVINSIIDIILLFGVVKSYYKNQYFCLCLLFFYCFNGLPISINLLRNSKVIYLFLISLKYLYNKQYIKYFLLNFIAIFFHTSAVIYILLTPFFLWKKNNKKLILSLFIIGNFLFLLRIDILSFFLNFILRLLPSGFSKIALFIDRYKDTGAYGIKIGFLERTLTFILFFRCQNDFVKEKYGNIFVKSYYIYYFCYLFLASAVTICERIGVLFSYSYWFLYPMFYKKLNKNNKYVFWFCMVIYSVLKLYAGNRTEDYAYSNLLF